MNIALELIGEDASEHSVRGLREWLQQSESPPQEIVRSRAVPAEGHMGVEPTAVLSVVLGSAAVVQFVQSLHVWLRSRRRRLKIKITFDRGTLELDGTNLMSEEAAINRAAELFRQSSS